MGSFTAIRLGTFIISLSEVCFGPGIALPNSQDCYITRDHVCEYTCEMI